MPYVYRPSFCFPQRSQMRRVGLACQSLLTNLHRLDLKVAGISEYNQRYLTEKHAKPDYEFSVIAFLLGTVLSRLPDPISHRTIVDYGAGAGLIGMIAKAVGFGTVIYLDIYKGSVDDSRTLGRLLHCPADHYICGDVHRLRDYMREHGLRADAIVSHDCIEHIYDIGDFLAGLTALPHDRLFTWLSSAANPLRPRTRRQLQAAARRNELKGKPPQWGDKVDKSVAPYLEVRRNMILEHMPDIPAPVACDIATRTRGRVKADIIAAVDTWRKEGTLPPLPSHPTNTCDPLTGNWTERLMDPRTLANQAAHVGLRLRATSGYWSVDRRNPIKGAAKALVNSVIAVSGHWGLRLAPYYVLQGISEPNAMSGAPQPTVAR